MKLGIVGMALKISLKPGEKIIVNGAVICNCERRASLLIQNRTAILREKDLMREEDADTVIKRIYFAVMSSCLDPENSAQYDELFTAHMMELMKTLRNAELLSLCAAISSDVMKRDYYPALVKCKRLLTTEGKEPLITDDEEIHSVD